MAALMLGSLAASYCARRIWITSTRCSQRASCRWAALPNADWAGITAAPSNDSPSAPLTRAFFMGIVLLADGDRGLLTTIPLPVAPVVPFRHGCGGGVRVRQG